MKKLLLCFFYFVSTTMTFSEENKEAKYDWEISIKEISFSDDNPFIEIEYKNVTHENKVLLLPIKKPGFSIKLEDLEKLYTILSIHITKNGKPISVYTYTELNARNKLEKGKRENIKQGRSATKRYSLKDFVSWGACSPSKHKFYDDIQIGDTCIVDISASVFFDTNKDTGKIIPMAYSAPWTTEVSMRDWQYIKYLDIVKTSSKH